MSNATVASRLDYCNSSLYGAKQFHTGRLTCCQNKAARSISERRRFDHMRPVLKELHWLPVEHRISCKIRSINIKISTTTAPPFGGSISPHRRLEKFERQSQPFGTLYPSAWSKLHLLTLSRPDLKFTFSTNRFYSVYVYYHDESIMNTIHRIWALCFGHAYHVSAMGLLPDTKNCGLCMRRKCRELFPATNFKGNC